MDKDRETGLYRHNQITYNEVLANLATHSRVAIIQATGTGKGFLASALVQNAYKDKMVLILAPSNSILQNYSINLGLNTNRCKIINYQGLLNKSDADIANLGRIADILFLDEFHRAGAPKWGMQVEKLVNQIESKGGKIIGLSATPKRYLDNARDMADELFQGNVVKGVDLSTAIMRGILPPFKYIVSLYGYDSDVHSLQEKVKNVKNKNKLAGLEQEVGKLQLIYDEDMEIAKIIKAETAHLKGSQKWIVFCNNKEELEEMDEHLYTWFGNKNLNIMRMHSDLGEKRNQKTLSDFNERKNGVNILLSVNMLNEGVHVKGISGVLMLRRTISPIVFMQQLGRALSTDYGTHPIIFDFIGNYRNLGKYKESDMVELGVIAACVNAYADRRAKKDASKGGKIIIKNYAEDMFNILERISDALNEKKRWTEEEDEIVRKYYNTEKEDIVKRLPLRDWLAIKSRASILGVALGRVAWSLKEKNIIKKYYPLEGDAIAVRLPNRTLSAIKAQAKALGVNFNETIAWTPREDDVLFSCYPTEKNKTIFRLAKHRTMEMMLDRLAYLGIPCTTTFEPWTEPEMALLQLAYGSMPEDELRYRLRLHTWDAIKRRASHMGLTRQVDRETGNEKGTKWPEEDIQALIELYNEFGAECYDMFEGRTPRSVGQKVHELKIQKRIV